jgi:hypothetical protein
VDTTADEVRAFVAALTASMAQLERGVLAS